MPRSTMFVESRRSVLLVKETGVPGKKHQSVASHWQTLSRNVISSTPRHKRDSSSTKSYISIVCLSIVRPMCPRYGNLLEVVDGNWMLREPDRTTRSRRKLGPCFVDGEGNSIIKPPLPCGIPIYGKGFGRKPQG